MGKRKYDLVFGLGMACSCSETLRAAGLQRLSFPYDWVAVPAPDLAVRNHELVDRVRETCNGFPLWLAPDDFEFRGASSAKGKDRYFNRRLGLVFLHDFPAGVPFEESFPGIREKYRRRADRLTGLIRGARRVLIVRIDRPDSPVATDIADCRLALTEFTRFFPGTTFDFLLFSYAPDLPAGRMRIETFGPNLTRCTFDYKDRRPGTQAYQPDLPILANFLRSRFRVSDYRTKGEKNRFKESRRRERFAKLGARNRLEYELKRLLIRLHLVRTTTTR